MATKNLYYAYIDNFYEYLVTVPGTIKKQHLNIVTLAHPRMLATSMTLPVEILRAAAQANLTRPRQSVSLHVMAKAPGNIELADGLSLASQGFDPDVSADVLLIPAIWRNPHRVLKEERWQLDLITTAAARGTTICSVGTGSYLLAETGLLDNRVATTHWHWFDDFSRKFPLVKLRRDRLITQSNGLFCVGSVNSIADLMVYLATSLFSLKSATAIENQFSPEIRRRFTPHELGELGESHDDEKILDAQIYLQNNFKDRLDLNALSRLVELNPRTFNRRFKAALGVTPSSYINNLRMEEAKGLLHHSNLPIAEIGWAVGIQDSSHFAQCFRLHAGVSPRQFREAVRGKSFSI